MGTVVSADAGASILRASGLFEASGPGIDVNHGDVLFTGAGAGAEVRFSEGTTLVLAEHSRIIVETVPGGPYAGTPVLRLTVQNGAASVSYDGDFEPAQAPPIVLTPALTVAMDSATIIVAHRFDGGTEIVLPADSRGNAGRILLENQTGAVDLIEAYRVVGAAAADAPLLSESLAGCEAMLAAYPQFAPLLPSHCAVADQQNLVFDESLSAEDLAGLEPAAGDTSDPQTFSSNVIVVTEAVAAYDLSPTQPTVQDAATATSLAETGGASFGSRVPGDVLLANMVTTSAASAMPEPVVLSQWDPGRVWDIFGVAAEGSIALDLVVAGPGRTIEPTSEDAFGEMAIVTAGSTAILTLENALSVEPASFNAFGDADGFSGGSAIRAQTSVRVGAGQSLAFDVFFDAAGNVTDNDLAVMTIASGTGAGAIVSLFDTQNVADLRGSAFPILSGSGWQTIVFRPETAGDFRFGFATLNDDSTVQSSRLLVDNIRLNPSLDPVGYDSLQSSDLPFGGTIEFLAPGPGVADAAFAVEEDGTLTIGLPGDTSADDILPVTDPDPFDPMLLLVDDTGAAGKASPIAGSRAIEYTPGTAFDYLAVGETATDTFTYVVDGGNGVQPSATITMRVTGANDAPIAADDGGVGFTTDEDSAFVTASILANDADPDGSDSVAFSALDGTKAAGLVVGNGDGTITYDPDGRFESLGAGQTATDVVTYTVTDSLGALDTGIVTITISGVNDAPVALADSVSVDANAPRRLDFLTVNDRDIDSGDVLTVSVVDGTAKRGRVFIENGAVVYDPAGAFDALPGGVSDTDGFTYRAVDRAGAESQETTVSVTIFGVNDAPVITSAGGLLPVAENARRATTVTATDADGDVVRYALIEGADAAQFEIDSDTGDITFRVAPDFEAPADADGDNVYDITVEARDANGGAARQDLSLAIVDANEAPTAVADSVTVFENGIITIIPLGNDFDVDAGGVLSIVGIDAGTTRGLVTLGADGRIIYDTNNQFDALTLLEQATDTFSYTISDGELTSTAEVTITIVGANEAPVSTPDSFAVAESDVLARDAAAGLLANDSDPEGAPLTVTAFSGLSTLGAAVVVNDDGSFTYDPTSVAALQGLRQGESVVDTFTYRLGDPEGAFAPETTVEITVNGANSDPDAKDDVLLISDDESLVVTAPVEVFLTNDSDPEGSPLQFFLLGPVSARGATLDFNPDSGSFVYDIRSRSDLDGATDGRLPEDSFNYLVVDTDGGSAVGTVKVVADFANNPPVAVDDIATTDEDSAVRVTVLTNDTDADLARLDSFRLLSVDSGGTLGTVRINPAFGAAEPSLTYDPAGAFDFLAPGETATDTFEYVIDDFFGATSTGTVTVTVTGVERPQSLPQEILESFTPGALDTVPWQSDLRPDFDFTRGDVAETVDSFTDPFAGGATFTPTHAGTMLLLNGVGTTAVTSDVADFLEHSSVEPLARPRISVPEFTDIDFSPNAAGAVARDFVLQADDLVDNAITLSFDWNFVSAETDPDINDIAVFSIAGADEARVVTLAEAAILGPGASGWRTSVFDVTDVFQVDAVDGPELRIGFAVINDLSGNRPSQLLVDNVRLNRVLGDDHVALVTVDGRGSRESDPDLVTFRQNPTATRDFGLADAATDEETALLLSPAALLANDRPSVGAAGVTLVSVEAGEALGAVSIAAGDIHYDPVGRFDSLGEGETATDVFRYTITDTNGGTASAEVAVRITGVNDVPEAIADIAAAAEDGPPIAIDVLVNDVDIDNDDDPSTAAIVSATAVSGAAVSFTGVPGGTLQYDPAGIFDFLSEGETAQDVITYKITDSQGAVSAESSVTVTITGVNDAPVANPDFVFVSEDGIRGALVLANDTDADLADRPGALRIVSAQSAIGATLIVGTEPGGLIDYDPRPIAALQALRAGETVRDTVTYTVADAAGARSTSVLTVEIRGADDAPTAVADAFETSADEVLVVSAARGLLANDSDAEGDPLTVAAFSGLSRAGAVVSIGDDGAVTYDATGVAAFRLLGAGDRVTDTFAYTVDDATGLSAEAEVTVSVLGVNDAPTAATDIASTREDETVLIDVVANDTDPDAGDILGVSAIDGIAVSPGETVTLASGALATLTDEGGILYDPNGRFDSLGGGEFGRDDFTYTVSDGGGAETIGSVGVDIQGRRGLELIVESFEGGVFSFERIGSVQTVAQYQEPDGARGFYSPTDGDAMALVESFGANFVLIEDILGLPRFSFPRDPVDDSFPTTGQGVRVKIDDLQAGDEISFDWVFDAQDHAMDPPDGRQDNDVFLIYVSDGEAQGIHTLSDVRAVGDLGATDWMTTRLRIEEAGDRTLAFLALGDSGGSTEVSNLLLDNIRINRDLSSGYQVVDSQADGVLETLAAQPAT